MSPFAKKVAIAIVALAIIAGGAGIAFYYFMVKPPLELAQSTADSFRQFFNFTPRVTINETVVIEQSSPIAELATVARDVYIETNWSHTWLGSTKVIVLRGTFTVKAGFDLTEPFSVSITDEPLSITSRMPPAKILSLEMKEYHVVKDEDGWWNRIDDKDREIAVKLLNQEARTKAGASDILREAEQYLSDQIREIFKNRSVQIEVR